MYSLNSQSDKLSLNEWGKMSSCFEQLMKYIYGRGWSHYSFMSPIVKMTFCLNDPYSHKSHIQFFIYEIEKKRIKKRLHQIRK